MFSKFGSLSGSCGSGRGNGGRGPGVGAPAKRPAYFHDVMKKLRCVERLRGIPEGEIERMAEELTEEEKLWSVYFSGMVLDPARDCIGRKLDGEVEAESQGASHGAGVSIKLQCRRTRGGSRYGVQSYTSLLLKHYGPIHASLLVGGSIVLNWETSGLVIPSGEALPSASALVSVHSTARSMVPVDPEGSTPHPTTPEEEILHEFEATLVRKELVDKLIGVVAQYNRAYLYHPVLRNCQKFLADCLAAVGRPIRSGLEGELGDYIKEVKRGRKRRVDFESHADLDMYVGGALESPKTTSLEREYLLAQYFLFHVTSMTECENPERWTCGVKDCRMPHLEKTVDLNNTIAYHMFLPEQ